MDSNWAAENIKVIRTLMERAAIYRRALAPIMLLVGVTGVVAGPVGWYWQIKSPRGFIGYWILISLLCLGGAYLLVRRQALKAGEAFWSPPTRRVTQAVLPPLVAGLIVAVFGWFFEKRLAISIGWLPPVWMTLYGCALNSAGFFTQRGIRRFGWLFLIAGCAAGFWMGSRQFSETGNAYAVMTGGFGGLHLAYGVYLYFTEPRKNET
jgi:hypothetical protein